MGDPSTYWLTFTNAALGLAALICTGAVGIGVWQELALRRKRAAGMAKLDGEVAGLAAGYDSHAFNVPSLGLTMADGGEEIKKQEDER